MKRNKRKALAAVLAVILALTLTPVTVHAAGVYSVGDISAMHSRISAIQDGDKIILTADISYLNNYASEFDGKEVTFDLNGHSFNIGGIAVSAGVIHVINSNTSAGGVMTINSYLDIRSGGEIAVSGSGISLNVNARVNASGAGSRATINSVSCDSYAVMADNGGSVTVNGNISVNTSYSACYGASVQGIGSSVTVNGDITVTGSSIRGVYTNNTSSGSAVTVNGDVSATGDNSVGVLIENSTNTTVSVTDSVTAVGRGVHINSGSGNQIMVGGDVAASGGTGASIAFGSGHSITVTGDVTASGSDACGARAWADSSTISVGGSVIETGSGVYASGVAVRNGGTVDVTGNVSATSYGVNIDSNGGTVVVGGDVSATSTAVSIYGGGTVNVTGNVSATVSGPYGFSCIYIYNGGSVTAGSVSISGDANSVNGVYTSGSGSMSVTVGGNVVATNFTSSATGVSAASSTVTVGGDVSATAEGNSYATGVSASGSGWALTADSVSASGGFSNTGVVASGSGTVTTGAIFANNYIQLYSPNAALSRGSGGTPASGYYNYTNGVVVVRIKAWNLAVDHGPGGLAGIGGTSDTSGLFEAGMQAGLIADDVTGYDFAGWTSIGGGSFNDAATASAIFTMPAADVTVTAEFEPAETYDVTISSGIAGGDITAVPTTAEEGDTIALTITPDSTHIYVEDSLKYNDGMDHFLTVAGISAPYTASFAMPDNHVTVSAEFEEITAPTIAAVTLPDGMETVSYTYTLSHNSNAPAEWTIPDSLPDGLSSGSLPDGLSLSTTGAISGTPAEDTDGTYTFTVQALNGGGKDTQELTLVILPAEPVITTVSLPDATEDEDYEFQLQATCAEPDYYWSVAGGSLPDGLSLQWWDGQIVGTPVAEIEEDTNYPVTIAAISSSYGTGEKGFTLTVHPAPEYALTLRAEHGSITEGTNCNYEEGAGISIAAEADTGYAFSEWTSSDGGSFDDETSTSAIFTMPGNATTVTAIFTTGYNVNIPEMAGGSITASPEVAAEGTEVSLTITPGPEYIYAENSLKYSYDDTDYSLSVTDNTATFTMPGSNVTVSAMFVTKPAIEVGDASALSDALDELEDGDTIRLIHGFTYSDPIYIDGIAVIIDTNVYTLDVEVPDYNTALTVQNGGSLQVTGSGSFNLIGDKGIIVENGGMAAIIGNITADDTAVYAYDGTVTVNGNITANGSWSYGSYADGEAALIEVTGDITAIGDYSYAVYVEDGGTVTAGGVSVSGISVVGVYAYGEDSRIEVAGDVIAEGDDSTGAYVEDGGTIRIEGTLVGDYYINIEGTAKSPDEFEGTTSLPGYNTFTDGYSVVWVKILQHAVTVQNDGNGIAFASPDSTGAGTEITLSASPGSGYHFKEWQAVTPSDLSISANKFIMPDEPVTVKAIFEENPPSVYTISMDTDGNGIAFASPDSAGAGTEITLSATPSSGYHFKEWQAVTPSDLSISGNAFIMPDEPVTVKAIFEANAAPDSPGGGRSNTPATPPSQNQNAAVTGGGSVPVTVDTKTGNASLDLGTLAGNLSGGGDTVVTVPSIPGANSFTASLPASSLSGSGQDSLTLNTGLGSLTMPGNMLSGTGLSGNAGVTIGEADRSNLPPEVGDRPVIQLTLTVNGQQTDWDNSDAPVTVSIPYTPTPEELEHPESIVVWYIDGSGNPVCIENGHYDPVIGTVIFDATHFSDYAVAYNHVSFSDVPAGAWYSKAVSFIAARDITTGTGSGNFSPNAKLTRGQFIVMLMKAYELAPNANPSDNFSDAGSTYYTGYLAAAKRLGISGGVGDNMFAPEQQITRQEMFTLLYNALKVLGRLPETNGGEAGFVNNGKPLTAFTDADRIAAWATDAMKLLVETGTVSGSGGKLAPTGTTTRAEMAQVLYYLLSK